MLISWVSSFLNILTVLLGGCPSPGEASCGPQSRAGVGKRPTKDGVAGGRGTQAHIRLLSPRLVVRPQRRGWMRRRTLWSSFLCLLRRSHNANRVLAADFWVQSPQVGFHTTASTVRIIAQSSVISNKRCDGFNQWAITGFYINAERTRMRPLQGECCVLPWANATSPPSLEMKNDPNSVIYFAMTFYWVARLLWIHMTLAITFIYFI